MKTYEIFRPKFGINTSDKWMVIIYNEDNVSEDTEYFTDEKDAIKFGEEQVKVANDFVNEVKHIHNEIDHVVLKDGTKIDGKELAGKGTKIENMENYYYLKIGNIITEKIGDHPMHKYEIDGYAKDVDGRGVVLRVKEYSHTKGKQAATFPIHLWSGVVDSLIDYMNSGVYSIDNHPYETDRDKILLQMEIDNIKKSFEVQAEKKEVKKKEEEIAQVKSEADQLLETVEKTKAGAKDTIEAMEALGAKKTLTYNGISEEEIDENYGKFAGYRLSPKDKKYFEKLHYALLHFEKNPKSKFYIGDKAGKGKKVKTEKPSIYDDEMSEEETKMYIQNLSEFDWNRLKPENKIKYQKYRDEKAGAGKKVEKGEDVPSSFQYMDDVNNLMMGRKKKKEKSYPSKHTIKKLAKVGKFWHARLMNPKGVKKCATPAWGKDLASSVHSGAKITTCQDKDGNWHTQNVMIPAKGTTKPEAKQIALKIASKISK